MSLLDRLERHASFLAIPQFPLFISAANGVVYLMSQAQPVFVEKLILDPVMVRTGEWWRLVTFLFVPPPMNPIFLVFWLLLIYQFGQALEQAWGEFRFFVFYAVGACATVAAALFVLNAPLGNLSLNTTLFLAFAALYPEFELLLFFVIPMRVKYIAYVMWAMTILSLVTGNFAARVAILASLTNYFLFFGGAHWRVVRLKWDVYRNRQRFKP